MLRPGLVQGLVTRFCWKSEVWVGVSARNSIAIVADQKYLEPRQAIATDLAVGIPRIVADLVRPALHLEQRLTSNPQPNFVLAFEMPVP